MRRGDRMLVSKFALQSFFFPFESVSNEVEESKDDKE